MNDPVPNPDDGCITCGDVACALEVVTVDGNTARCRDGEERFEDVATDLVGPVQPGERVLVHAGVALLKLADEPVGSPSGPTR